MSQDFDNYWQAVQDVQRTSSPNWLTPTAIKSEMSFCTDSSTKASISTTT